MWLCTCAQHNYIFSTVIYLRWRHMSALIGLICFLTWSMCFPNVRFSSRQRPRCLSFSNAFNFLLISCYFVLHMFIVRTLSANHVCGIKIPRCISSCSSLIQSKAYVIKASSAYKMSLPVKLRRSMSFPYVMKLIGPNFDPWGTPTLGNFLVLYQPSCLYYHMQVFPNIQLRALHNFKQYRKSYMFQISEKMWQQWLKALRNTTSRRHWKELLSWIK